MQDEGKGGRDEAEVKSGFEEMAAAAYLSRKGDTEKPHQGGGGKEGEGADGDGDEDAKHGGIDRSEQTGFAAQ